ncbi:MAG: response regulator [Gemmatimonadaceae bacterium]
MRTEDAESAQRHFANKIEAIARLGGGVAHQFNNLLTAILGTADLVLADPKLAPAVRADLNDIREAAQRAAAITRQLLAFSGSQSVSFRPIDVNELLTQLEPMLKHVVPNNVSLKMRLDSSGLVEADPIRVEQVVLSVVLNAVDAMAQGGSVTVTTQDVNAIPSSETQQGRAGAFTEIVVADTGYGMDDFARARLFEPFFSTKDTQGGGIGLGLASVYGTMQQLDGGVVIESLLGAGTRVRLFLPRAKAAVDAEMTAGPSATSGDGEMVPSEVILVVEDEPAVRAPICRQLRNLGYFVLEANNGEDALLVMQEYHSPIHLVITDVMMPEMNGAELVSLLRDWYPHMRVLFISGYSEQYLEARGGTVQGSAFMAKPFSLDDLKHRVREMLDVGWQKM